MLRSVAITRIQRGLGFRLDLTDNIVLSLQEAQRDLEGATALPWFLISQDQALAVTAGSQVVTVPTTYLRVVEDQQPHYTNAANEIIFLTKKPFDEAKVYYAGADAGAPVAYTLRESSGGATIRVWPVPNINYTLTWAFYGRGLLLDGDIENTWLKYCPELLIGMAGLLMAADLENEVATKKFAAMYSKWASWLVQEIAVREEQGNPRAMGRNR